LLFYYLESLRDRPAELPECRPDAARGHV